MIKPAFIFKVVLTSMLSCFTVSAAKLNIMVRNIQTGRGTVVVEIYDSQENFMNKQCLSSKKLKATDESLQFTFPLPEGIYALKVFQDINENGKCDEGWFHIPKEPYGLGNNFRPKFSAPSFEDCKFMVSGVTIQTIRLKK